MVAAQKIDSLLRLTVLCGRFCSSREAVADIGLRLLLDECGLLYFNMV
jgi:hypothetical protein